MKTWRGRRPAVLCSLLLCLFAGRWQRTCAINSLNEQSGQEGAGWRPHPYFSASPNLSDIHMSHICGFWQKPYAELHRAAAAPDAPAAKRRYIIYSCDYKRQKKCGGLGDRMLGMLTTFMIGLLTDRAFFSDQPPDLDMVYEPVAIDWHRPAHVATGPPDVKNPGGPCSFGWGNRPPYKFREGDAILELMLHDYNPKVEDFLECFRELEGVQTVVVRFNRGLTVGGVRSPTEWGRKLRAWGLREPYITGCMLRYLLRPKQEIEESVRDITEQLQGPDKFSICIHSRPGHSAYTDEQLGTSSLVGGRQFKQTENLILCAKKLSEYWTNAQVSVKWFLMASSYAAKQIIKKREGDKVLVTEWVPLHTERALNKNHTANEQDALLLAGKEWTIFSKCNIFLFHDSGLSKTAALYALKPMSMYLFPRQYEVNKDNFHTFCKPGSPADMNRIASNQWSGA